MLDQRDSKTCLGPEIRRKDQPAPQFLRIWSYSERVFIVIIVTKNEIIKMHTHSTRLWSDTKETFSHKHTPTREMVWRGEGGGLEQIMPQSPQRKPCVYYVCTLYDPLDPLTLEGPIIWVSWIQQPWEMNCPSHFFGSCARELAMTVLGKMFLRVHWLTRLIFTFISKGNS